LVDGTLRDTSIAGHRALDSVYAAVRDPAWGTVPGTFDRYEVDTTADGFHVWFACRHASLFAWRGRITGSNGVITFEMAGRALKQFAANRIGFCLLHPIELAGRPVVTRTRGGETDGWFPDRISAHQPFRDLTGMRYAVADGVQIGIEMTGDVFETEDHRNWTDAGFKTYCTPLSRPYPVTYRPGDVVRQGIRLSTEVDAHAAEPLGCDPLVEVSDEVIGAFPALGFGWSHPVHLPALDRLRALRPRHLHLQLPADTSPSATAPLLAAAARDAAALGSTLDVTVHDASEAVADLLAAHQAHLGRVTVTDVENDTTTPGSCAQMRSQLHERGMAVAVGGGTTANFAELNRLEFTASEFDFLTYGISPQLHHSEDSLVMDTLLAQPDTVRDAAILGGGRPVLVRPVTLHRPGGPPDVRQRSLFLASWTVGSLAGLSRADAVTFFDATGPAGLFDDPDHPFPVWMVFAAVAGLAGSPVYHVRTPRRKVAALAVGPKVLMANLRNTEQTVELVDRARSSTVRLFPYAVVEVRR
jgi:D-apionolactonase